MKNNELVRTSNGTYFHKETIPTIINILEKYMHTGIRLFLDYGDTKTGKSWGETYDIQGTIGRSTGSKPIPLLIKTKRSMGGTGVLDHCIVRIKFTGKNGRTLYKHPKYKCPTITCDSQAKLYADVNN